MRDATLGQNNSHTRSVTETLHKPIIRLLTTPKTFYAVLSAAAVLAAKAAVTAGLIRYEVVSDLFMILCNIS